MPSEQVQTTHENERVQFSFTSPDPLQDLLGIKQKDASWDIHLKRKKFPSMHLLLTAGSGSTSLCLVTAS